MRDNLVQRAKDSLAGNKRPRVVYLRRAVSDCYYALFHALALHTADTLVGASKRNSEAWRRIYRGLGHGHAKGQFNDPKVKAIDPRIARIGSAFVQLQQARHQADYDPLPQLHRRSDVVPLIAMAEAAFVDLDSLDLDLSRELAAILLIQTRN